MARPNIVVDQLCTFCLSPTPHDSLKRHGDSMEVPCPCCGNFWISGSAIDAMPHWDLTETQWSAIAYRVKRMTGRAEPPRLDIHVLRALRDTARLPHPDQIIEDLIVWSAQQSRWPGDAFRLTYDKHRTLLGAVDRLAFDYMLKAMDQSSYFYGMLIESLDKPSVYMDCALAPAGWERFRELSRSVKGRRYGFMAMKYGDREVDALVREHLVPQVKLAGFDLQRLDEGQPAGLIDDQLRVRIRQAKFLICDLTHGNRGAYWEGGFAEGLGIPVIYTCRLDVFTNSAHEFHPHFDTAHWVTVPWEPANPALAAAKLKAIVRATLPDEAKLED